MLSLRIVEVAAVRGTGDESLPSGGVEPGVTVACDEPLLCGASSSGTAAGRDELLLRGASSSGAAAGRDERLLRDAPSGAAAGGFSGLAADGADMLASEPFRQV